MSTETERLKDELLWMCDHEIEICKKVKEAAKQHVPDEYTGREDAYNSVKRWIKEWEA